MRYLLTHACILHRVPGFFGLKLVLSESIDNRGQLEVSTVCQLWLLVVLLGAHHWAHVGVGWWVELLRRELVAHHVGLVLLHTLEEQSLLILSSLGKSGCLYRHYLSTLKGRRILNRRRIVLKHGSNIIKLFLRDLLLLDNPTSSISNRV